jgi:septin family protein
MKAKSRRSVHAQQPFILVVVGDSASGKTTLLDNLRRTKSLHSWVGIRDMDENGCPRDGREHWRKYRVEELLADSISGF